MSNDIRVQLQDLAITALDTGVKYLFPTISDFIFGRNNGNNVATRKITLADGTSVTLTIDVNKLLSTESSNSATDNLTCCTKFYDINEIVGGKSNEPSKNDNGIGIIANNTTNGSLKILGVFGLTW
jgi:hypothetical protein